MPSLQLLSSMIAVGGNQNDDFAPVLRKLAIIILLLSVLYIAGQIIYNYYFHPLAKFPGPPLAALTRAWIAYHCWIGDEAYVLYDLSKKYGASTQTPLDLGN